MAALNPALIPATKEAVIQTAEQQHSQWPQYEHHWRTPEWRVLRVKRDIKTKLGTAFYAGELTIGRVTERDERDVSWRVGDFVTAYSLRNGIDTSIRAKDIEWCEA